MHDTPSPTGRRLRAAELFAQGFGQADVARALGVSRTTAMRWHRAFRRDGRPGLARTRRPGRPPKLSGRELSRVLRALPRRWSVDRLAAEIERRCGVRYHPGHLWRILKAWGFAECPPRAPHVALRDPDGHRLLLVARPDGA